MTRYTFCGLTVSSSEALPLARVGDGRRIDIRMERSEDRKIQALMVAERIHQWRGEDGEISLTVGRRRDTYLLEHPGVAIVEIGPEGDWLRYRPDSGAPPDWVRRALLNQTLPRVMAMRGRLVLHASAVVAQGRLLVFAGKSGAGKSTLARELAVTGLELAADDCVELLCMAGAGTCDETHLCGNPGHPGWDTKDESGFKQSRSRVAVAGVYHLQGLETEPPTQPAEFRHLSMLETVMLLNKTMFVLDPTDSRQLRDLFDRAIEIGSKLAAFELKFPWGEWQLPAVVERVSHHAANLPSRDAARAADRG